jgi:hypothetical protein
MSDTGASGMTVKPRPRSLIRRAPGFRDRAPKRNALVVLWYLLLLTLLVELLVLFVL